MPPENPGPPPAPAGGAPPSTDTTAHTAAETGAASSLDTTLPDASTTTSDDPNPHASKTNDQLMQQLARLTMLHEQGLVRPATFASRDQELRAEFARRGINLEEAPPPPPPGPPRAPAPANTTAVKAAPARTAPPPRSRPVAPAGRFPDGPARPSPAPAPSANVVPSAQGPKNPAKIIPTVQQDRRGSRARIIAAPDPRRGSPQGTPVQAGQRTRVPPARPPQGSQSRPSHGTPKQPPTVTRSRGGRITSANAPRSGAPRIIKSK